MSEILITDRRGNIEERAAIGGGTSAQPAEWMIEVMGGGRSSSGVDVTRTLAMTIGAFNRAVKMITGDLAKTPLCLMRHDCKTGRHEIVYDDPLFHMVRYEPNEFQHGYEFRRMLAMHKEIYGRSIAYKVMNGRGEVQALIPLVPESVQIFRVRGGYEYHTTLYYDDGDTEVFILDDSQVMVDRGVSHDGVNVSGALRDARDTLGRIIAMRTFGSNVFKNSGRPATILKRETPFKSESAQEKFLQMWQSMYSGVENAHKTAILPPGMDLTVIGSNARDSQFIEQEQQCVREVANFFDMPASKLNENAQSAYKSLEQDEKAYENGCLDTRYVSSEETYNRALLTREQRMQGYCFKYQRDPTRSADIQSLGEYYSKALGNNRAWLVPNEIRARLGLNPIEGGDDLPTSVNPTDTTAPGDAMPEDDMEDGTDTTDATDPEEMDAVRMLARDAVGRAVTRLVNKAKKAYRDGGEAGALVAVDCRTCDVTAKAIKPVETVYSRATRARAAFSDGIAAELFAAVGNAARAGGPSEFESNLEAIAASIPERLIA